MRQNTLTLFLSDQVVAKLTPWGPDCFCLDEHGFEWIRTSSMRPIEEEQWLHLQPRMLDPGHHQQPWPKNIVLHLLQCVITTSTSLCCITHNSELYAKVKLNFNHRYSCPHLMLRACFLLARSCSTSTASYWQAPKLRNLWSGQQHRETCMCMSMWINFLPSNRLAMAWRSQCNTRKTDFFYWFFNRIHTKRWHSTGPYLSSGA